MPFLTALDSTKYNALRGNGTPRSYKASQYMCVCSNTVVMAAQVNQASVVGSLAAIAFNNVTSGVYTAIEEDMTVLISATSDPRDAYFVSRARKNQSGVVATSAVLLIEETSAFIASGDYLFVLRDYRPYHKLGRVAGGTYFKDYGLIFAQLKPVIYNLQSAYAGVVSGSPAGFTVPFAALAIAGTSSATISSYAWTFPAGTTVTAGATNTANVTVRFDASATEYWVKLVVTDSGGRTQTRHIPVWAVPADFSTTVVRGFTGAQIEGSLDGGFSGSVEAFAGVEAMLDNTLCCVFDVEYYQDTAYSLFSTVKFVGRFRKESQNNTSDLLYSSKRKVSFEIEGAAAQLARLAAPKVTTRDAASPAVWDEIKNLTIWRAIAYLLEHSTFHELFSLSFDSTDNAFLAFELQFQNGSLLTSVKDLASAINANLEFSPTGEVRVVRDINYAPSGATAVGSFGAQDWINIDNLEIDPVDTVGIVEASGGVYNPTGGGISPTSVQEILALAPGVAQGHGTETAPLTGQILTANVSRNTAQTELNTRAGNHYAYKNGAAILTLDMRGAYNWLIPSAGQYYQWTISADDNRRGLTYDTSDHWFLKSVTINHDNVRGNKTVSATYQLVTSGEDAGVAGQTIVVPPQNNTPSVQPSIPPIIISPNFPIPPDVYLPNDPTLPQQPVVVLPQGDIVPTNGASDVIWCAVAIWVTQNFIGTPQWIEITPEDLLGTIRGFVLVGQGGYLLESDGTNSRVRYLGNVFAPNLAWPDNDLIDGEYTQIAPTSTEGTLYIKGGSVGSTTVDYDFTANNGGWTVFSEGGFSVGAYSSSTGWTETSSAGGIDPENHYTGVFIEHTLSDVTVTAFSATYTIAAGLNPIGARLYLGHNANLAATQNYSSDGTFTISFSGSELNITTIGIEVLCGFRNDGSHVPPGGAVTVTEAHVTYGTISGFNTRYSEDKGQSFDAPVSVGSTDGGIDTVKIGAVVLAAADGQVKKATSGGSYADYGDPLPSGFNPTCLIIPRYKIGSTTLSNAISNPDYLIFSDTEDDDGETAYAVSGAGVTFTPCTPEVSGDKGLATGSRCAAMPWWSGNRIAAVLQFGSLNRLVVSVDGGGSWTDRGVLDDGVGMVTFRKGDHTMSQLFLVSGGVPYYSGDYGASLAAKTYPASPSEDPLIGIAVVG